MNEAGFLINEGVSMQDVDEACLSYGMPMGPCRLLDEIGIDVGEKVSKVINGGLGDRVKPSDLSFKLIEKGFLGKKSGKGFYLYDEKGKSTGVNEGAISLFPKVPKKEMSEIDIQKKNFSSYD